MAAAICYVPDWIQVLGRWRSSTNKSYIRPLTKFYCFYPLFPFTFSAMGSMAGTYMWPQFCLLGSVQSQKIGVWYPAGAKSSGWISHG